MKELYLQTKIMNDESKLASLLKEFNLKPQSPFIFFFRSENPEVLDADFTFQFLSEIHTFSNVHVLHEISIILLRLLSHHSGLFNFIWTNHSEPLLSALLNSLVFLLRILNEYNVSALTNKLFELALSLEPKLRQWHENEKSVLCHPCEFFARFLHSFSSASRFSTFMPEDLLAKEAANFRANIERILVGHNVNDRAFFNEAFKGLKSWPSDALKIQIFRLYFNRYLKAVLEKPGHFEKDVKAIIEKYLKFMLKIVSDSQFLIETSSKEIEKPRLVVAREFIEQIKQTEFVEEFLETVVCFLSGRPFWADENGLTAILLIRYLKPQISKRDYASILTEKWKKLLELLLIIGKNLANYSCSRATMEILSYFLEELASKKEKATLEFTVEGQHKVIGSNIDNLHHTIKMKLGFSMKSLEQIFVPVAVKIENLQVEIGFGRLIKVQAGQKQLISYYFSHSDLAFGKLIVLLWRIKVKEWDIKFSLSYKKNYIELCPNPTSHVEVPQIISGNVKIESGQGKVKGFGFVKESGIYSFVLDNTYSLFRPKMAKIWICVLSEQFL